MRNQFNIFSDYIVIVADLFYHDYFSMSFWMGDIVYNLIVMEPFQYDYNGLFPENGFL